MISKTIHSILLLLITGLVLIFNPSCKSKKTVSSGEKPLEIVEGKKTESVKEIPFDFNSFALKARANYSSGSSSQSFTMNIRMKKDSVVWVSVNAVGLEVIRVLVDQDSVRILDRFNKKYYVKGLNFLEQFTKTPVSLLQLQYLLLGNSIYPLENFDLKTDADEQTFFSYRKKYVENNLYLNQFYRVRSNDFLNLAEGQKVSLSYSDFKPAANQNLAMKLLGNMQAKENTSTIELEFSGPAEDPSLQFPFYVPDKYGRE